LGSAQPAVLCHAIKESDITLTRYNYTYKEESIPRLSVRRYVELAVRSCQGQGPSTIAMANYHATSWQALLSITFFFASIPQVLCWKPRYSDEVLRRGEVNPSQIADMYDYIIVGGGQAGVVIASRLTEDPDGKRIKSIAGNSHALIAPVSVLVVEYGYFNNDKSVLEPQSATRYFKNVQYNMTSLPQRELNGYKQDIYCACTVGGGSTIVCRPRDQLEERSSRQMANC
jgi:hypothetical protein